MARHDRHRPKKPAAPLRRATARIEEIASAGDGVAVIDGARVFVPLTAPGDVAEIEHRGERGALLRLVEKSPHRALPPCRHFGECGGCALQHLSPGFYRDWKKNRIVEALKREGLGGVPVLQTIETPPASRRRATFAARKRQGRVLLGFNARRSAAVVDLEDCCVLAPELLARLPALRALAGKIGGEAFDLAVTLCDNGLDVAIAAVSSPRAASPPRGEEAAAIIAAARAAGVARLCVNGEIVAILAPPVVRVGGVPLTPPEGGFLQASREGEAALIALVLAATEGARKIADLFSGSGTFALPLARSATVYALDGDRAAVEALSKAAADAQRAGEKINPVRAETRDLFERPLSAKELKGFDAVVFDPPRAGAEVQAREIAGSAVPVAVGVSCNPATFARDARALVDGGYRLEQVTPIDQFVYSPHVELVGVFRKG